jgi:hypothetical protein
MGEQAEDMIDGLCCSECGVYFEEEHGYPVLCETCYKKYINAHEDPPLPVSIEKEQ